MENSKKRSTVAALRTSPTTVIADYNRLLDISQVENVLRKDLDTVLKLNLSWTKYFPACSSQPWQVEGVLNSLLKRGYAQSKLHPVENKTVVTNPIEGAKNNKWMAILQKYGVQFTPLTEVEWEVHSFKEPLLKLNEIFPEGILVPKMFKGRQILHFPTVKTHGHSTTTGAIKNAFGGLLKEVRHYAHKYMHEVLVDLMIMQKELHPAIFAVMDGTVCGDGAGPRTLIPRVKNWILASSDSVAIDAVAARMMGFEPMEIPYIRMCTEKGLGQGDMSEIEIVGDDITGVNFNFSTKKSFVIWGDQLIRKGWLQPLEHLLLHSPLWVWAPLASNLYHDAFWYPTIGAKRIARFMKTEWGKLFQKYQ